MSGLIDEDYLARKRLLETALEKAGVAVTPCAAEYASWENKRLAKIAFNANLPLAVYDHIPLFDPTMHTALKAMQLSLTYARRMDYHPDYIAPLRDAWRSRLRYRFIHQHKGKKPKRGNPRRSPR